MRNVIAKNAVVHSKEGCARCQSWHKKLRDRGYRVITNVVKDGEERGMGLDAFAQLHMQDGVFPVIWLEDEQRWIEEEELND